MMQTAEQPVIPIPELEHFEAFGLMCVMDQTGDFEVKWNRRSEAEITAARATFDQLRAKRYLAYKTNAAGERGEVIHAFDPNAECIVLSPPMVGG